MRFFFLFFFLIIPASYGVADDNSKFSFITNVSAQPGPTLLVIAGIDGDEPGAFHAAATLATRYRMTAGKLWIVPDLNRDAILKRERGKINLKFAHISENDPLYYPVQKIKEIIDNEQIDLVINLHDGSGFYYPKRISRQRGPQRWGQCFVIDQKLLDGAYLGDLHGLSVASIKAVNPLISKPEERFHIKNMRTTTLEADAPTYHSLTWYALRNNTPALSIESSKSHRVHLRTYYLLLAFEALMNEVGVTFSRDFTLTPAGVRQVIEEDGNMTLAFGRISLGLNDLKSELHEFPLSASAPASESSISPLISLQPEQDGYRIHYGNNRLALLRPKLVNLDPEPGVITLVVDGLPQQVVTGSQVAVSSNVQIQSPDEVTVRVIGLREDVNNQQILEFSRQDLNPDLAIDRGGKIYRLEMYRGQLFSGMILLDFH